MNDFNGKLIQTSSKEESIAVLLILFSHGFTWISRDVVPEPNGNYLDDEGNIFYLNNNLISYDTIEDAEVTKKDIFINIHNFLKEN